MSTATGASLIEPEVAALKQHAAALIGQGNALNKLYVAIGTKPDEGAQGRLLKAKTNLEKLVRLMTASGEAIAWRLWAAMLGMFNKEARARILLEESILGASRSSRDASRALWLSSPVTRKEKAAIEGASVSFQEPSMPGARTGTAGGRPGGDPWGSSTCSSRCSISCSAKVRSEASKTESKLTGLATSYLRPDPVGDGRHAAVRPLVLNHCRTLDLPTADPPAAGDAAAGRRRCAAERDPVYRRIPTRSAPWPAPSWSSGETMPRERERLTAGA